MRRAAWMIALIWPIALLWGCAMTAPELPKSETSPPERFVAQEILQSLSSAKDAGVAGVRWWEGFNDPVLNELVSTSIQNNFQIAAVAARVKEARALLLPELLGVLLFRSDFWPLTSASSSTNNESPASLS